MRLSDADGCRLFDLQRFSIHDGPGIRTTVFLRGCPLRCAWCQNPEAFTGDCATVLSPDEVINEVLKDTEYYAVSGGGLTVSGGEPLVSTTAVRALLDEAKRHKLHTCVQTSGAVPERCFTEVLAFTDLFQFDLKHMDSGRHQALTGHGNEQILANAARLVERGAAVQFRMPLLPGINDAAENLEQTARFLLAHDQSALRLVPYQRLYLHKYAALGLEPKLPQLEPPGPALLQQTAAFFGQHGVAVEVDG